MLCLFCLTGCGDTNIWMATEAGMEAVKAITLSDAEVREIAAQSSDRFDSQNSIASTGDKYADRLNRLVGHHFQEGDIQFNYKVYLSETVNAFAMADGTIRIYSGLMDMMNDGELRFVVGHEMGHIIKRHIHKKVQLAYAASAVRKGIASQNSEIGDIARSGLGALVEQLANAQFSQLEEKEADDYGLTFLKNKGYDPKDAVTALEKLATLGKNHSFLSSHPDPDKRAQRLKDQLAGKATSIEDKKKSLIDKAIGIFNTILAIITAVMEKVLSLFS